MLVTSSLHPEQGQPRQAQRCDGRGHRRRLIAGGAVATVWVSIDAANDRIEISLGGVSWPNSTITARGLVYYKSRGGRGLGRRARRLHRLRRGRGLGERHLRGDRRARCASRTDRRGARCRSGRTCSTASGAARFCPDRPHRALSGAHRGLGHHARRRGRRPVGTIHDLISGINITMPSDDARPLYRVSGGVHWLECRPIDAAAFSRVKAVAPGLHRPDAVRDRGGAAGATSGAC